MTNSAYGAAGLRGYAMARNTEAVLRAVGATTVHVLRLGALTGTLQQRQLGQTEPQYDDIAIGPAFVSVESVPPQAMKLTAVLPARVVNQHAEQEGAASGAQWLATARGILYQGTLLRITDVKAELFAGVEYLYRVTAEV